MRRKAALFLALTVPALAAKAKIYDLETKRVVAVVEYSYPWFEYDGSSIPLMVTTTASGQRLRGEFNQPVSAAGIVGKGAAIIYNPQRPKEYGFTCEYALTAVRGRKVNGIGTCLGGDNKRYKLIF